MDEPAPPQEAGDDEDMDEQAEESAQDPEASPKKKRTRPRQEERKGQVLTTLPPKASPKPRRSASQKPRRLQQRACTRLQLSSSTLVNVRCDDIRQFATSDLAQAPLFNEQRTQESADTSILCIWHASCYFSVTANVTGKKSTRDLRPYEMRTFSALVHTLDAHR